MKSFLEFIHKINKQEIIDGPWADDYVDAAIRERILTEYRARYTAASIDNSTPATAPELFNPLTPPAGWKYDPYYETWVKL